MKQRHTLLYLSALAILGALFYFSWLQPEQPNSATAFTPATAVKKHAAPTKAVKSFTLKQLVPPEHFQRIWVHDVESLERAVSQAHKNSGNTAIILADGTYHLAKTLLIQHDNIWFLSASGDPYRVILKGLGMHATNKVHNLFRVSADHFVVDGLTLSEAPNHLIQIAAESKASYPIIRNSILKDAYEQFLKVSYSLSSAPQNRSYGGVVEHCIFQYSQGIAPNFYTGGIDALGAVDWLVQDNLFMDIASPKEHIAQHAVHFWVNSSQNIVRNNLFIDNDRGIGFGMVINPANEQAIEYSNRGGVIQGNFIYHSDNQDPFADVGIILEDSPKSHISENYIYSEHAYPRAIEYRFKSSKDILIEGNYTNRAIAARNGAQARLERNRVTLTQQEAEQKLQSFLYRLEIRLVTD